MNSYVVLWKTGNRDLYWYTGLPFDEFKQKSHDLNVKGYRIVSIDVDEGLFTAVWKRGSFGQYWECFDSDEIGAKGAHYDQKGYRMVYIDHDDGKLTVVWEPGHDSNYYCFGKSMEEFSHLDQKRFDAGGRLSWIAVDDDPGFSAVWRHGTGEQHNFFTSTFHDFTQKVHDFEQRGLRLTCVDKIHAPGHYMGVVRPGTGNQHVDFMSYENILETDKDMAKKGMELAVVRRLHYSEGLFPDLDGFQK